MAVKRHRKREKRFRPEKIISEREFLTNEHRSRQDLPTHLEVLDPKKRRSKPAVNSLTRKHLGNGRRPRWFDFSPRKRGER